MRVSILNDLCGVSCLHAKYLNKLFGVEVLVSLMKKHDYGGVAQYYGADVYSCGIRNFLCHFLIGARKSDLIHIHAWDWLVERIDLVELLYRFMFVKKWKKSIILHYHGSEIRGHEEKRRRYWEKADCVLVANPDLLEYLPDAIYLPNPVDIEIFKPMRNHAGKNALYYIKGNWSLGEDLSHPFKIAEKLGLNLSFLHKSAYTIPYVEMPAFLNLYDYLIDIGYVHVINRIALEALACGLKVVDWEGKILDPPLPKQHHPKNVAKELMKIYESYA